MDKREEEGEEKENQKEEHKEKGSLAGRVEENAPISTRRWHSKVFLIIQDQKSAPLNTPGTFPSEKAVGKRNEIRKT